MGTSIETICHLLVSTRLLSEDEVQRLHARWRKEAGSLAGNASCLCDWLVANQYLTAYQADRILRGKTDHYFFNDYKLLGRIGAGRMAGVYKAVHYLGQVVAIKVLPPSRTTDPQAFGRFQHEARLALRLKHPNVVRTFQTGACDRLHYLVMEYLDGETLEEVLRRRHRLPTEEAARLVHQALLGLQHLYEQGIVHRDLKPANLMLVPAPGTGELDTTGQATVKILDIGVARSLFDEGELAAEEGEKLTSKGDLLSAPDYLAPEQAHDAHAADVRADVYSLGCVLYHALTGQPPFPDGNTVQKIVKHATVRPRPLRECGCQAPEGLQRILDRMMAKSPAQRYATPSRAARALESFLKRRQEPAATDAVLRVRKKLEEYEAWLAANDPEVRAALAPAGQGLVQRHARALLAGAAGLILLLLAILVVGGIYLVLHRGPAREGVSNTSPTSEGRVEVEDARTTFDDWLNEVAALAADQQVEAVEARLKELNPDFPGPVRHKVFDSTVTELELVSDGVTDLAPVRALPGLRRLNCAGSAPGKSRLASLEPLRGMGLTVLDCSSTAVSDLGPLRGMSLVCLDLAATQVRDLTPLADMQLVALSCAGTHVRDLSPLEGMPLAMLDPSLTRLDLAGTPVDDLSALRKSSLKSLDVRSTRVTDLTPLRDMPLTDVRCDPPAGPMLDLLRGLKSLVTLNGQPLQEAAPAGGKLVRGEAAGANASRRPTATTQFRATLREVHRTERELVVRPPQAILVQSSHDTYWMGVHLIRLREAALIRDPRRRMLRMEEELYWIAFHRSQLYRWHRKDQDVVVLADEDIKVRVQQLPPAVDESGKPRSYKPEEVRELKGPDSRLPGYASSFDFLSPGQVVDLYVARSAATKPTGKEPNPTDRKAIDPRPHVGMIVVQ